jgi:hypothetical protein
LGGTKWKKQMLDEEGELPTIIGNFTPIVFVVHEEVIMFVNERL